VVKMKMSTQDIIDLFGRDPCIRQLFEEVAGVASMPMRKVRTCLVVTDAAINKDNVMSGAKEIALNWEHQSPVSWSKNPRHEPMKMRVECFVRAVGEPF
jgi:hypothetical protein